LYILFAGALLFGGDPAKTRASIPTSMIPLWWNMSIIGQHYGTTALNGFAFSPMEMLMIWTALVWLVRSVLDRDFRMEWGAFIIPILAYIAMVTVGFFTGVARGGDTTVALWEVRQQFVFLFVYLLTANLVKKREDVLPLLYITVFSTGFVALCGTFTYFAYGSG